MVKVQCAYKEGRTEPEKKTQKCHQSKMDIKIQPVDHVLMFAPIYVYMVAKRISSPYAGLYEVRENCIRVKRLKHNISFTLAIRSYQKIDTETHCAN